MYAEAGIAVYWIINIPDRVIEVYEAPNSAERQYERMTAFRDGDVLGLPVAEGPPLDVSVSDLLP